MAFQMLAKLRVEQIADLIDPFSGFEIAMHHMQPIGAQRSEKELLDMRLNLGAEMPGRRADI